MLKATGSATGGAAGKTSTPGKGMDQEASKGGSRPKEDVGRGATGPDHRQDEALSKETSPRRSPSAQHNRECYALLFGAETMMMTQDGPGAYQLPSYAWNEQIITNMLRPTIDDISQVIVLNDRECLVFKGHQSRGEGFPQDQATCLADAIHGETTNWVGRQVRLHWVPRTLKDARNDLHRYKGFIREQHLERIRQERAARQQTEHERRRMVNSLSSPRREYSLRGRGYVRWTDHYTAQQMIRAHTPEVGRVECECDGLMDPEASSPEVEFSWQRRSASQRQTDRSFMIKDYEDWEREVIPWEQVDHRMSHRTSETTFKPSARTMQKGMPSRSHLSIATMTPAMRIQTTL